VKRPVNEDSDHGGLPDWWELKYFGGYGQSGSGDYDGDASGGNDRGASHDKPAVNKGS